MTDPYHSYMDYNVIPMPFWILSDSMLNHYVTKTKW